jgi:hypothetical protein
MTSLPELLGEPDAELENAITTAGVLNRAELERAFSQLADAPQQAVYGSNLRRRI